MDTGLGDVESLDPDSLQLPELSSFDLKTNHQIAEDLFSQWLSLPETVLLVKSLIDDAKERFSFNASGNRSSSSTVGITSPPSISSACSTSLPSPRCPSGSPRKMKHRTRPFSLASPLKPVNELLQEVIPQFYFPNGRPPPQGLKEQCISRINHLFNPKMDRLQLDEFKTVTKEICKLPSFFSSALFRKIDIDCTGIVTRDAFVNYWVENNMLTMDIGKVIFKILKQSDCNYLTQVDFMPILQELLATHEGLKILQGKPGFQGKYAETVIYRIFYYNNRSGNGRLTLRELKRGNLIAAMQHADEEEDINKVLKYFSYQHFFVIFHTFRELDTDHDFFIDKENLWKYDNHALSNRIIDRIFSQVPRKFTSKIEGKMGHEDFVYFLLAEVDKSSEPSLEYWFKCIDLDGNGVLTADEMMFFFDEQITRLVLEPEKPIVFLFEDILCQIFDMIAPERKDCITLQDLKRCKLSGNVFNILFNLKKFLAFKAHGVSLFRQVPGDPSLTEWDCFAEREYVRLSSQTASEEDTSDGCGED